MKKILIVGKNSYVGKNLYTYLNTKNEEYEVNSISLRNIDFKEIPLYKYEIVIYLVGVAHKKETRKNKEEYYKVNYELTCNFAEECKIQGVKNFLFVSSMSVFGNVEGEINKFTVTKPTTYYGKSKLLAEKYLIENLRDNKFQVTIVRPPMIYGSDSVGNYSKLSFLARVTPIFLTVNNKRSMIYIGNLLLYIEEILNIEKPKIYYHPQNNYYMNTTLMVKEISSIHQNKIKFISINKLMLSIFLKLNIFKKMFGDLYYSESFSTSNDISYIGSDFSTSIYRSEQSIEKSNDIIK